MNLPILSLIMLLSMFSIKNSFKHSFHLNKQTRLLKSIIKLSTSTNDIQQYSKSSPFSLSKPSKNGSSLPLIIFVDPSIRSYLKMKNNERKTRILLPSDLSNITITNQYIRDIIEKRLISLYQQPYILR